ncbi:MAG: NAD-dependent epimerase/dehydratase family protein [Nannocystaceae bacterium]|nr:NAD-dependent epimerase/dehydratase family protein [Nannocystaceae bacterium]
MDVIDPPVRKALVTGAPGFVGAHLVRQLLDRGVEVRGLAAPNERLETLAGLDLEVVRSTSRLAVERRPTSRPQCSTTPSSRVSSTAERRCGSSA